MGPNSAQRGAAERSLEMSKRPEAANKATKEAVIRDTADNDSFLLPVLEDLSKSSI